MSTSAEYSRHAHDAGLPPLAELIERTPGAHPVGSVDELRSQAFATSEELDEFLAFVTQSRRAGSA